MELLLAEFTPAAREWPFHPVERYPEREWFGGRNGSFDYFGEEWHASSPPSWKYRRRWAPHIWCELTAHTRHRRGRISAKLTYHYTQYEQHVFAEKTGLRSKIEMLRWATREYWRYFRDGSVYRPWRYYEPAHASHVYERVDEQWVPRCSLFADSWAETLASLRISGEFVLVRPDGVLYHTQIRGPGSYVAGGLPRAEVVAHAETLRRWTRWWPSPSAEALGKRAFPTFRGT